MNDKEFKISLNRQRYVSQVCISNIERDAMMEKKAKERKNNPPKPGIRGRIKQLNDLGFPEEQLIVRVQKEYKINNNDISVITNLLNEVKKETKKMNKENINEK